MAEGSRWAEDEEEVIWCRHMNTPSTAEGQPGVEAPYGPAGKVTVRRAGQGHRIEGQEGRGGRLRVPLEARDRSPWAAGVGGHTDDPPNVLLYAPRSMSLDDVSKGGL